VDRECERVDGSQSKTDPPAVINSDHVKIQPQVDVASKSPRTVSLYAIGRDQWSRSCTHKLCISSSVCVRLIRDPLFTLLRPVLSEKEKIFLAGREKDKGNEGYRAGDYEEAIAYYSRSATFILKR